MQMYVYKCKNKLKLDRFGYNPILLINYIFVERNHSSIKQSFMMIDKTICIKQSIMILS